MNSKPYPSTCTLQEILNTFSGYESPSCFSVAILLQATFSTLVTSPPFEPFGASSWAWRGAGPVGDERTGGFWKRRCSNPLVDGFSLLF